MADYLALREEIAKPGYAGKDDQAVCDLVNARDIPVAVDVRIGDVEGFFRVQGLIYRMEQFIANPPADANQLALVAAHETLGLIQSPHITVFRMSDPATSQAIQNMLSALAAQGILSSNQHAAVLSMAQRMTSLSEQLGFANGVVPDDLIAARAV